MSDLRHKTPDELRWEINYQTQRVDDLDRGIRRDEDALEALLETVRRAEKELDDLRMKRNRHHQRLVWAKNYLMMNEE